MEALLEWAIRKQMHKGIEATDFYKLIEESKEGNELSEKVLKVVKSYGLSHNQTIGFFEYMKIISIVKRRLEVG